MTSCDCRLRPPIEIEKSFLCPTATSSRLSSFARGGRRGVCTSFTNARRKPILHETPYKVPDVVVESIIIWLRNRSNSQILLSDGEGSYGISIRRKISRSSKIAKAELNVKQMSSWFSSISSSILVSFGAETRM